MKKLFIVLLSMFLLTGCSLFKSDVMEDVSVYTTIYPLNYIITDLYGEHAKVYSIYPTGVEFNNYQLSEKKISDYAKSDLFVFNSQDQDRNYAVSMINENKNLKLIDAAYGMNYNYSIEELWLNPYNYLMMAKNVKNSLAEYITNPYLISNKDKTGINDKYEMLQYELSKLDAVYKDVIGNGNHKTIVTDNKMFKFLEKYGITVIALEEDIQNVTISNDMTLSDISKKYNITVSDILTYNNRTSEIVNDGEVISVPVSVIDSADLSLAKKLINNGKIKYIYSNKDNTNSTVNSLITANGLEIVKINDMYSIDGGVTNNNETYLTIMNNNLELFKKELYK